MNFAGAGCVCVGGRSLPASFLERELNGYSLTAFVSDDVRAGLNASISVERGRLVHLGVPVRHRIVQSALHVGSDRARVWALVHGGAKLVTTRSRHQALATL